MADKDKKKKVEDDEEDEELTAEVDIDKEASLSLLGKKKWSHHWFMLSGQDLLYKKSETDPEVKGVVKLNGAKIEAGKDDKKEHVMVITSGDDTIKVAADSADVLKDWMEALKSAAAGKKEEKKKKQSRMMALKKNLAGKVATSGAGKKMLEEFMGKEGKTLLKQLRELITLQDGKSKAKETEDNIIKLGVKVLLLYRNKDIAEAELRKPVDFIRQLWSDVLDMLEISFCYDADRLKKAAAKLEEEFTKMLGKYISGKNMEMLGATLHYLGSEPLMNRLFTADDTEKLRPEMQNNLRALWDRAFDAAPPKSK